MKPLKQERKAIAIYDPIGHTQDQLEYWQANPKEFMETFEIDEDAVDIKDVDARNEYIAEWVYGDYHLQEYYAEDFQESIYEIFNKYVGMTCRIDGSNMGWQNKSGEIEFELDDAQEVLSTIVRQINDFTAYIYEVGDNVFEITMSHHDSPMGESHIITFK